MSPVLLVAAALIVILAIIATQSSLVGAGSVAGLVVVFALLRTLRQFKPEPLVSSQPVLGLVLLPLTLGVGVFSLRMSTLAIWGLVLFTLASRRDAKSSGAWWIAVMLIAAWVLPVTRNQQFDLVVLYAGVFALLIVCACRHRFPAVISALFDGIGLYLVANVLGQLAGLESPAAANRTYSLESTTGGLRVFYPFASGLSIPPALAAIFIAGALICLEGSLWRRAMRTVALAAAVWIMIEANTRTAIMISVAVCLAVVFAPRLMARAAVPTVAITAALPFAYPMLVSLVIRPVITSVVAIAPFLSRGNVERDIELEGRSTIWANALDFWLGNVDLNRLLLGYGKFGHFTSGASSSYITGPDPALYMFSVHNSAFQQLFDGGVVGVGCLVAAWVAALLIAAKEALVGSRAHLLALAAMVTCMCGGATEVTQAPGYGIETFWVLCGFVIAIALAPTGPAAQTTDGKATSPSTSGRRA